MASVTPLVITAPPLSADFMCQYKDDGLVLNTEATGLTSFVDITRITGLDNAPIRVTERDWEGQDGGFIDAEFESARTVIIEGTVYGPEGDVERYLDSLKANYAPSRSSYPFYVRLPRVGVRTLMCKSGGVSYDVGQRRRVGQIDFQITLMAGDPSFYTNTASGQIDLGGGTTIIYGRGYNKSYNFGYGGSGQHGPQVTITPGGNRQCSADIMIYGPVQNPTLYLEEQNRWLRFDIILNAGDVLVVNLRNRTVLLNGTANRRSALKGDSAWFMLSPGSNTFRFEGIQTVPGPPFATAVIQYSPAFR
jgi:hypothetical protein